MGKTPSGTTICLMGIDGSGKTTLAARLGALLTQAGYSYQYLPSRHGLVALLPGRVRQRPGSFLFDAAQTREVTHLTGRWSHARLIALLFLIWMDNLAGYWLFVGPRTRRKLTLLDRYFYDHLMPFLDLAPRWLRWCYLYLLPRPDLVVLLDVPAEEAWHRKETFSPDFLIRMRQQYLQFAKMLGNSVLVVDNSAGKGEEVAQQVYQKVVSLWEARAGRP